VKQAAQVEQCQEIYRTEFAVDSWRSILSLTIMCTITFVPKNAEYLLAMNRDDLLVRAAALPLVRVQFGAHAAVYPQENGGGTWIGVNQAGIGFSLLNWAIPPKYARAKSRGTVIPQMLVCTGLDHARMVFEQLDLASILPFRLVGFSPVDRAVAEWRWDGEVIAEQSHEWAARHWFSSGASDDEAARIRREITARWWQDEIAGSPEWIRRLHASHEPERGVFSICAHRSIGGTLSYTEIEVASARVSIAYSPVSPCQGVDFCDSVSLPRLATAAIHA
jgi:Transport and Golgi organisation 2